MKTRPRKIHQLKTEDRYWTDVDCYGKTFEVRKDDRDFQLNDTVLLFKGLDIDKAESVIPRRISYILRGADAERFGVKEGYCVFEMRETDE